VETKAVTLVDTATAFEIRQYAWSPDSQWVTWTRPEDEGADEGVALLARDGTSSR
jgi:tricorn protease-like protein